MKTKKKSISRTMHVWLLTCVVSAFVITSTISFVLNTSLSRKNTISLLQSNLVDVCDAVHETDSLTILNTTLEWANYFDTCPTFDTSHDFMRMITNITTGHNIDEINIIDENGIIITSNVVSYHGYVMADYEQSREFLVLLRDSTVKTYVQELRTQGYDNRRKFRYAASVFKHHKGFIEIGINEEHYNQMTKNILSGFTRHRRIGDNGCIYILDENLDIISAPIGSENISSKELGVSKGVFDANEPNALFECTLNGIDCYCMYSVEKGCTILAVQPVSEATLSRNTSVLLSSIIVFVIFFLLINIIGYLIRRLVVKNIDKVNDSLTKITEGNLDEEVNVRDSYEFDSLSTDINSTVNKLKVYIHEAETRMDADLALAKAIQLSTLPAEFPAFPDNKEFDVYASMLAAKEVGGDFYDFYFSGENKFTITIADVAGKGIPAAMFMMRGKTTLKNIISTGVPLDKACTKVSRNLCKHNDTMTFFTGWIGTIDLATGQLTYVNAGHNLPVIRKNGGEFCFLACKPCLPVAVFEDFEYQTETVQLQPGDELFLYTDGVTEAANVDDQLFGDERLIESLNSLSVSECASPEKICKAVLKAVQKYAEGAEQSDDITMLCFKYEGMK